MIWMVGMLVSAMAAPGAEPIAALSPTELSAAFAPRRVALIVGVNDYDERSGLDRLRYAARDAAGLAAVLGAADIGDFEVSLYTQPMSRSDFWAAFEAVAASLQPDDTLLVYFSGHGARTQGDNGEEVLLLSDGRLDDVEDSGLRLSALADRIQDTGVRRRVLIVDACRNSPTRGTRKGAEPQGVVWMGVPSVSDIHLFATAQNQPAEERSELQHSTYTHFLIEALQPDAYPTVDANEDGLLEVAEVHAWATSQTVAYTNGWQVPSWKHTEEGRAQIYLAGDPQLRATVENTPTPGKQKSFRMSSLKGAAQLPVWGLSIGGVWRDDSTAGTIMTPWAMSLAAYRAQARAITMVRATSTVGRKPLNGQDWVTSGTAEVGVARTWGSRLRVGPIVGGGLFYRVFEDAAPQSAGLVWGGALVVATPPRGPLFLTMSPVVGMLGPSEPVRTIWTYELTASVGASF